MTKHDGRGQFAEHLAHTLLLSLRERSGFAHVIDALSDDVYASLVNEMRDVIQYQLDTATRESIYRTIRARYPIL